MKKFVSMVLCLVLFVGVLSPVLIPTADAATWYTCGFSSDRGGDFGSGGFGGGQRGGWGSTTSGSGLSPTTFGYSEIAFTTLSNLVVQVNDWFVAGAYYDLFGDVLYNAKINYNEGGGYYYIVAYSGVTKRAYSFCDNAGNLYIAYKETAATPSVDVDVSVTTTTFDDTNVLTALYGVWQTLLLQVDCQLITAESVLTDAQVNLAILTRFDDYVKPFMDGLTVWNLSVTAQLATLVDCFSDLQNLYGYDARLVIHTGDELQWDSAFQQEPVVSYSSPSDASPVIYSSAPGFSQINSAWVNGVFTLTPATGTNFPQSISLGNVSVDMPSHVVSTAVPNPAYVVPDGYTQYDYIAGTGTQWINTGYIGALGDTHNLRIGQFSGLVANQAVWGRYFGSGSGYNFDLVSLSASQLAYKYPDKVMSVAAGVDYDIFITQSASACTLVVNGTSSTISNSAALYNQPIHLLHVMGRTFSPVSARVYGYTVTDSAGNITLDLVPCSDSSGAVGVYDTVSGVFKPNACQRQ